MNDNDSLQTVWGNMGDFPRTPHVARGGFPCDSPYLRACLGGRNLYSLQAQARWFLRLPPLLVSACLRSREWLRLHDPEALSGDLVAQGWYDEAGHELDPATGRALTAEELLRLSGALDGAGLGAPPPDLDALPPDPTEWLPSAPGAAPAILEEEDLVDREGLTVEQILSDIASRGRAATAAEYGVPASWLSNVFSDEDLARMILGMDGKPWPER